MVGSVAFSMPLRHKLRCSRLGAWIKLSLMLRKPNPLILELSDCIFNDLILCKEFLNN